MVKMLISQKDFPGSPVVKTLGFHCRRHGFDPWSGKLCLPCSVGKKKPKQSYGDQKFKTKGFVRTGSF